MGRAGMHSGLRPFVENGYEIVDTELAGRRGVAISSVDALAPRLGDLFTLDRRGVVHELAVVELSTFRGGWSALCRVRDVF